MERRAGGATGTGLVEPSDPRAGGRWSRRVPVGTALIAYDDVGRFVVIQRTGAHGEGTWAVPGGWLDPHEAPEECARRETWEEVGIKVGYVEFLGFTYDAHVEGVENVTLWFKSSEWSGRPRPVYPGRIADVRMVTLDEMPQPRFLPFENAVRKGFVD